MEVLDEKNDEHFEVFCPPALQDYINSLPIPEAHIIEKNLSQPLAYSAIEKSFRRWRDVLGAKAKPYTLHGLRKIAIIRLAEAGCTDAQIQAVTNQSLEMIAYYRRLASRKTLSRSARDLEK